MKPFINPNGVTVSELKLWLFQAEADLSDEPKVWVEMNGLSNEVTGIWQSSAGDVILEIRRTPMLQKMYKNGEETMPSSEEYMEHLFKDGWSITPPPDPNALPDDLPLRDLLGGLTLPQVKALIKKLTPKMLDKIKEALK